jgi:polysaccharide export outer membrane protein
MEAVRAGQGRNRTMPQRGRRHPFAWLGFALGTCLLGSGCETLPHLPFVAHRTETPSAPAQESWRERIASTFHHSPSASSEVLQPHSVVYWSAVTGSGSSTRGYRGRSTVGPDGSIHLGPYGSVQVAGLNADQARAAINRQVAHYVKDPHVAVSLTPPAHEGELVARQAPAQMGNPVVRTGHAATSGPSLGESADSRVVPTAAQTLAVTPRDDPPVIQEPASSPDLPFPRPVSNGYSTWHPNGNHPGMPGRAPNELNKTLLPAYIIEPPDILLIEYRPTLKGKQPIGGQHLVNPDGTVHLGTHGSVRVTGLTLEGARQAIGELLRTEDKEFDLSQLNVDILAYNSKVYYVITDGAGYGEQVYRFPVTGNETVLDAISLINGLPPVASKRHIWLARRNPDGGFDSMLPVDWISITQRAAGLANYQILPGDRLYVQSDKWRRADTNVQKVLSPFERILGATLLGASTVQEIRGRTGGAGGSP